MRFWRLQPEKKIHLSVWRVVLLCQFLVLAGNLHFFVVAGNFDYDRKKKIQTSVGGKLAVFCCGGKFSLRPEKKDTLQPEKKDTVVCLMGAQFWQLRLEKNIYTIVCLAGCAVVSVFSSGGKLAFFL